MALKLLLADESITIRKVVTKIFSVDDHKVASVDTPEELASAAQRLQPDIVLLSTDFTDGVLSKQLDQIAELTANPNSVILMGNRGNGVDESISRQLGAAGFVYKPIDNRELQKVISQVLTGPQESKSSEKIESTAGLIHNMPAQDGVTSVDQRAKILFSLFESYFNENMVALTDAMTKDLVPKVAAEVSSKIMESTEMTELPKQILNMTKGIVTDLVPQIAERVITREIESIKEEAIRLIEAEDDSE